MPRDLTVPDFPTQGFKTALPHSDVYMGTGVELSNGFTSVALSFAPWVHLHEV